jgi:hypothetical protein
MATHDGKLYASHSHKFEFQYLPTYVLIYRLVLISRTFWIFGRTFLVNFFLVLEKLL